MNSAFPPRSERVRRADDKLGGPRRADVYPTFHLSREFEGIQNVDDKGEKGIAIREYE